MIKNLIVKNIKCFEFQNFSFSNFTIFCGANSAGKSTALQCLLILRQTFNSNAFNTSELNLIGEYFSIGHVSDLISQSAKENEIAITIDDLEFVADLHGINLESYKLRFNSLATYSHDLFTSDFVYLCAERLGPRNSYDVGFENSRLNLGIYGEFSMAEFVRRASIPAVNQRLVQLSCRSSSVELSGPGANEMSLEIAVKTVMRKICPGFDIDYESHKTVDRVSSTFSSHMTKTPVRPVNSGFGVSNVFPIVVAAFCIPQGGTLIVENPEVHLHPGAQSELAQFLGQLSLSNVQVIIETHSDHIINGTRLFAKNNEITDDHVAINSIGKLGNSREIRLIRIDNEGNLSDYQPGFFDQAEKDLLKLF